MKFEINGVDLTKAIDRVCTLIPPGNTSEYGMRLGPTTHIFGFKDDSFACIDLGLKTSKSESYIMIGDISLFKAMVKGRKDLEVEIDKTMINIVSGRYKGEFKLDQESQANPGIKISFDKLEAKSASGKSSLTIEKQFFSQISKDVNSIRLTSSFVDDFVSVARIVFDSQKSLLEVLAYDEWHMHLVARKISSKVKSFNISISTNIFSMLDKVVGDKSDFHVDSSSCIIYSDDLSIILPPVQNEEADAARSLFKDTKKALMSATLDPKLQSILDNISGLLKKDMSDMEFKFSKKSLQVTFSSDYGTVSDKYPITDFEGKEITIRLSPKIFYDTFKTVKLVDKFVFSLYANDENVPCMYKMKGTSTEGSAGIAVLGMVSE